MTTNVTNFVSIIKACESAGGSGTKKMIKAALETADATAQRLIMEALNPYRVFGIRKYDRPKSSASVDTPQAFDAFFDLLDRLHARELTGNAAAEAVTNTLCHFTLDTMAYVERVFDKDLRAGFSADTFNKIHPNNQIPTFKVMLADKCQDQEDFEKNITFPCQADFKYDGERTIAFVKKDEIIYYSRSGKVAEHVNGLFDEELRRIHDYLQVDFVLDGERYASNFTETVNAKKEGNEEAKKNLRFRAFFLMPLSDWIAKSTDNTMRSCRNSLTRILDVCKCEKIILSEGREVKDYHDMMEFCNEAIDKHGVEGLILKDWDSEYQWDRSLTWCKVKRFYDVDCKVVGTYKGRPKTRLENVMGGIEVVGFLEDGTRVEARVGSGFSDEDRVRDDWVGKVVVIKYQDVTKAKNKTVASLRFPTYERCRDDKDVEV